MPVQDLPPTFLEYQEKANFLGFIDIDVIPFNCLLEIDFHDKLIGMTVMPIAFVILVSVLYAAQRVRLSRQAGIDHAREIEYLQVRCHPIQTSTLTHLEITTNNLLHTSSRCRALFLPVYSPTHLSPPFARPFPCLLPVWPYFSCFVAFNNSVLSMQVSIPCV
jgi:hypothetical protein